jgi:hypothetical protein
LLRGKLVGNCGRLSLLTLAKIMQKFA